MKIDAHQHFWRLSRGDYHWLTPEKAPLYQDFEPSDLLPLLKENGIDGTVTVQAAPTPAETDFMLSLADDNDFILGVVGWCDFESADASDQIRDLAARPKLVGLRPMIQGIADVDWMLKPALTPAFETMVETDLGFDALTLPKHLPNLARLMERHPDLRVVIDHGSKPDVAGSAFDIWAQDMRLLASDTTALVKMSGLVTEAGSDWSVESLKPYVDFLLEHFGPQRLMWGSDWPVCTLASSYRAWCDATDRLLEGLDKAEKAQIWGATASRFYNL
ncbi:MAG: amidohydrolase family protein [Paracoccaceae bacterium]